MFSAKDYQAAHGCPEFSHTSLSAVVQDLMALISVKKIGSIVKPGFPEVSTCFLTVFSFEYFVALDYKNLVDESWVEFQLTPKKKKRRQTKNCDFFFPLHPGSSPGTVLFLVLEKGLFLQGLGLVHSAFRPFFAP